jgi:uncharacterized protein (TIGR03435 family)
MLQNLLKDRFGLVWHFQEKPMKGYHLVVARGGSKLQESTGTSHAPAGSSAWQHGSGSAESHGHSGPMVFGDSASYRASGQSMADLVRVLSDQLGAPVDDQTGLSGKYDIALRWSGANGSPAGNHAEGSFGGAGHAGHDGGAASSGFSGAAADPSAPALFDALQQQLGLRLVPGDQANARLFVVDRVEKRPAEN